MHNDLSHVDYKPTIFQFNSSPFKRKLELSNERHVSKRRRNAKSPAKKKMLLDRSPMTEHGTSLTPFDSNIQLDDTNTVHDNTNHITGQADLTEGDKLQDLVHKKDAYSQTDLTGEYIVKLQDLVFKFNKDVQNLNENLYRTLQTN